MINYQWEKLLATASDSTQMYGHAYGALDSMLKHHRDGAMDCEQLEKQRILLNEQVEVRFNELVVEAREKTEAWLNRSLENLRGTAPNAAIYEDGAALDNPGDQILE